MNKGRDNATKFFVPFTVSSASDTGIFLLLNNCYFLIKNETDINYIYF